MSAYAPGGPIARRLEDFKRMIERPDVEALGQLGVDALNAGPLFPETTVTRLVARGDISGLLGKEERVVEYANLTVEAGSTRYERTTVGT